MSATKRPLTLMIVPCGAQAETTKVALALVKSFQKQNFKTNFFQPINQRKLANSQLVKELNIEKPIDIRYAEHLLSRGEENELLEIILELHDKVAKNADVVVVKGLSCHRDQPYTARLNASIANALDARVLLLATGDKKKQGLLEDQIQIVTRDFNIMAHKKVIGFIINRINTPADFIPCEAEIIANIPCKKRPKLRKDAIINFMSQYFHPDWIQTIMTRNFKRNFSTIMFRYELIKKARAAHKKIILPEATDPRILQAAMICTRRKIAHCILLGHPDEVKQIAHANGIELNDDITIINPRNITAKYVDDLVHLRKHKGMTKEIAEESLQDLTTLATMMLYKDEVDGIVSGAVHTTANTIRPALQIIKMPPHIKLVSSLFFMCLKEQVMVYADCAIVPNPTAEELAQIAIETADSAALFGIEPKVAMISYSTGSSGQGADVEKVREATNIVRKERPDILIDGPIQYDAAVDEETARKKIPESQVAGSATVCIFPDLNTGNALYKAVQRSADITSIGPMLQGLNKPVNDLSRGCLVEDIVFTIAITAIQATMH